MYLFQGSSSILDFYKDRGSLKLIERKINTDCRIFKGGARAQGEVQVIGVVVVS